MYKYSFSDSDSDDVTKKVTKLSDLEKNFADIDEKYTIPEVNADDYNKTLSLERETFVKPSDEEIKKQATDSLTEYSNDSRAEIESDYQKSTKALDEDLNSLEKNTASSKSDLTATYDKVKKDASNDAVKRGLARSSIIVNQLSKYDNEMLTEYKNIEKNYLETSSKLTAEKSLLEVQKQSALDSFDISYAAKLSLKIGDINEKLQAKEQEVLAYNNKVEELEKDYEADMQKQLQNATTKNNQDRIDYLTYLSKNGTGAIESLKSEEKYKSTKDYLMTMPKIEAIWTLEHNEMFQKQLGAYYSTLVSNMEARSD